MNNEQILVEYCKEKLIPKNLFKNYIHTNPNFIFTLIKDSRIDVKEIALIKGLMAVQRKQNIKFKNELLALQSLDNHFIGLKGYFLQLAYYPEYNVRLFHDIDILSEKDKRYCFYKQLRKLGYRVNKHKSAYRKIIHSHMAISILRNIYTAKNKHIRMINDNSTIIELHTNINDNCPRTCDTLFNIDRMFDESICKKIGDLEFYIFSPVDNMLYLMFHTISHLSYVNLYGNRLSINIQSFYDVAQIISNEQIDWDLFCKRATDYNINPFAALFLKLFDDIYIDMIPTWVKENILLQANSNNFGWKYIFNKIQTMEPTDLILGDYSQMPEIMQCYEKAKKSSDAEKIWKKFHDKNHKTLKF